MSQPETEVIVRAVLEDKEGNLVLCRMKGAKWFFLPGGHVEPLEPVQDALSRELKEELGIQSYTVTGFKGLVENSYTLGEQLKHEINIIFGVTTTEDLHGQEDHIEFLKFKWSEVASLSIRPAEMQDLFQSTTAYQNLILAP